MIEGDRGDAKPPRLCAGDAAVSIVVIDLERAIAATKRRGREVRHFLHGCVVENDHRR